MTKAIKEAAKSIVAFVVGMVVKACNVYRRGVYFNLFQWVMDQKDKSGHRRAFSRKEFLAYAVSLGMSDTAASASVGVILSPTESSERGDCRGNMSAMGHLYYMERITKDGETLYKLHFRKEAMEAHRRAKPAKDASETPKAKASGKAKKAKTPAKAKAKGKKKSGKKNPAPAVPPTDAVAPQSGESAEGEKVTEPAATDAPAATTEPATPADVTTP